jgi:hypothetical protein
LQIQVRSSVEKDSRASTYSALSTKRNTSCIEQYCEEVLNTTLLRSRTVNCTALTCCQIGESLPVKVSISFVIRHMPSNHF